MVMTTRKMVKAVYGSQRRRPEAGTEKRPTGTTGEGVNEVSNDEPANDADDSSDGDRGGRLAERDTTDEDDGFHTLTEDGNHG